MKREELDRKFDEALGQALDTNRWTAGGMQAWAIIALAIAVRGLWLEWTVANPKGEPEPDVRDFLPPINQGGG